MLWITYNKRWFMSHLITTLATTFNKLSKMNNSLIPYPFDLFLHLERFYSIKFHFLWIISKVFLSFPPQLYWYVRSMIPLRSSYKIIRNNRKVSNFNVPYRFYTSKLHRWREWFYHTLYKLAKLSFLIPILPFPNDLFE